MSTQDIITAVSTLGFPIVMCAALFWYMVEQRKDHAEESKETRTALEELKVAITELTTHLREGN